MIKRIFLRRNIVLIISTVNLSASSAYSCIKEAMVPETVALKSHLRISADMGQKFIFLSQDSNVKIDSTHFIKSGSQGAKKQSGSPKVDFLKSKEKFGAVIKFSLIDDNIFERGLVIKGTQGSGQFVVEIQINPPTDSLEGDCGKPVIKIIQ